MELCATCDIEVFAQSDYDRRQAMDLLRDHREVLLMGAGVLAQLRLQAEQLDTPGARQGAFGCLERQQTGECTKIGVELIS